MSYENLRKELKEYYFNALIDSAKKVKEKVFSQMDEYDRVNEGQNAFQLKAQLYKTIAKNVRPTFFNDLPFYCETGALVPLCDGTLNRGAMHASGWLYLRNRHLFREADPEGYDMHIEDAAFLHKQTQIFIDLMHHALPTEKIFSIGLCGVYKQVKSALASAKTDEERDFLSCAKAGVLAMREIANKFAKQAKKQGLADVYLMAKRVPWQPPKTYLEGLCALAFLRKALGTLEGVGFNSFGRVDKILYPLCKNDLKNGVKESQLLDYTCKFILIWDSMLDTSKKFSDGWAYELENALTLGGVDVGGKHVYNKVTTLFLKARKKLGALYPKMMIRFSQNSPQKYMEKVCESLMNSQNLSLFANDDVIIPAIIKSGAQESDAIDYSIGGCWDSQMGECSIKFGGEYVNILKLMEWYVHANKSQMEKYGFSFEDASKAQNFEEFYAGYFRLVKRLLEKKAVPQSKGSREWSKVHPVPLFSALAKNCVPNGKDFTAGGGKYNWESVSYIGIADVVDSMLVVKKLCFDQKVCSLERLQEQCRENWKDESLRLKAINTCFYGDGTEESSLMASRVYNDLIDAVEGLPTAYGGRYKVGFSVYTEVVMWKKEMLATPNGRRAGDYFSPGITPSRIKNNSTLSDVLYSMRYMDLQKCGSCAVLTFNMPAGKIDLKQMVEFFRVAARNGIQSMQPNCVNKEDLIRAQTQPEKYGHLIVRVCGFSAPFVLLSPVYQAEFLSRNFNDL